MSNVTGYIDGIAYTAVFDPEIAAADPDAVGSVTGSGNVLSLLSMYEGKTIEGPIPSGPMTVDCADEKSVLRSLMSLTHVHEVSADAPDLTDGEVIPADAVH